MPLSYFPHLSSATSTLSRRKKRSNPDARLNPAAVEETVETPDQASESESAADRRTYIIAGSIIAAGLIIAVSISKSRK